MTASRSPPRDRSCSVLLHRQGSGLLQTFAPRSKVFVGRQPELDRLRRILVQLPVAIIYGVAGVGKSALAYALAQRWGHPVVHHKVGSREPLGALLDDLRRKLTEGPVLEGASDSERLAQVAELLDAKEALCVLDDVHLLARPIRQVMISDFGRSLRTGRLLATSRELLSEATEIDRCELRIDGLDRRTAQEFWGVLDDFHGCSKAFDTAFRTSHGNPLLLRRAHARGGESEVDPIVASLQELNSDERRLAGALALSEMPLPSEVLLPVVSGSGGARALELLAVRMIVETDDSGCFGMHDLFREAMLVDLTPEETAELRSDLARLLAHAHVEQVARAREVCRHLCALQRYEQAGDYLLEQSRELVRQGAAGELVRAFDSIPPEFRTPAVRMTRARTLGRMLDLRRAFEELKNLVAAGFEPQLELKLAYSQVAMMTGQLMTAERGAQEVLDSTELSPDLRVRAETTFALIRTYQGRGAEGRAFLDAAIRSSRPIEAAQLLFCKAFSLLMEERNNEADEPMRCAHSLFGESGPQGVRGQVLTSAVFAGLLGRLGRFEEAKEMLDRLESQQRTSDLRSRLELQGVRAILRYEQGERLQALADFQALQQAYERGGCAIGAFSMSIWVARILFTLGRRHEGLSMLDRTEAQANAMGVSGAVQMALRVRGEDPFVWIADGGEERAFTGNPGPLTRARAYAAVRAAHQGDVLKVHGLLEANALGTAGPGYALERALGHFALAVLALREGKSDDCRDALEKAQHIAVEGGVDPDLLPALAKPFTESSGFIQIDGLPPSPTAEPRDQVRVLLDTRTHQLRSGRKVISFHKRPILRKLLYALARHPQHPLSKEELAACLWPARYNPNIHDNALLVNLSRLRSLIAKAGLKIDYDGEGYLLSTGDQDDPDDPTTRPYRPPMSSLEPVVRRDLKTNWSGLGISGAVEAARKIRGTR